MKIRRRFWTQRRSVTARFSPRSAATRAALVALIASFAAPLPALADGWHRDREDWRRPHPVYVAPAAASAAPYAYPPPAYPAPVVYRSCNNALVGGLIGAAAGGLIGSGAASHSRDAGAATLFGLLGGAAIGSAVGAASCD
jgi:hypothetical protein